MEGENNLDTKKIIKPEMSELTCAKILKISDAIEQYIQQFGYSFIDVHFQVDTAVLTKIYNTVLTTSKCNVDTIWQSIESVNQNKIGTKEQFQSLLFKILAWYEGTIHLDLPHFAHRLQNARRLGNCLVGGAKFPDWQLQLIKTDVFEVCAKKTQLFFPKKTDTLIIRKIITQVTPATVGHYDENELRHNFGYSNSYFQTHFENHNQKAPAWFFYCYTPVFDRPEDHIVRNIHVLIVPRFETAERIWERIADCAQKTQLTTVVLPEHCKKWLGSYTRLKVRFTSDHPLQHCANEIQPHCASTLFIHFLTPGTIVGSGELDTWFGQHTLIGFLCWPLTNEWIITSEKK